MALLRLIWVAHSIFGIFLYDAMGKLYKLVVQLDRLYFSDG